MFDKKERGTFSCNNKKLRPAVARPGSTERSSGSPGPAVLTEWQSALLLCEGALGTKATLTQGPTYGAGQVDQCDQVRYI